MMIMIIVSLVPLAFKEQMPVLMLIDKVTVTIFIIDYLLRLATADMKLKDDRLLSFIRYPFTPMALVDLLSILPSLSVLNQAFRVFKIFRLIRTFRVFRVFKAVRYSKSIMMIIAVFRKQKESLLTVLGFALMYVLVSALVVFNAEPETFKNFFDAIYWATVSLTTMGYGDIYPVTNVGRGITMISSILGIAIVALPASIITAGYMEEINNKKEENNDTDKKE
jgi:voltage-gated potassium channel